MQGVISSNPKLRVVIVGAGFAGLSAAKALAGVRIDLLVIDRHNYHLFQPLLYQVATAGLSPADIASPIRQILRKQSNANVMLANVSGVDLARKEVLAEGRRIAFDKLIVATGAQHSYFGHDEWAKHAPGLKRIDDATYLRRRILLAFEKAETETGEEERRRLLNFVVVGAGPTGVELAGAIAELAKRALALDFRTIDPTRARIILIEAGPRVLPTFDSSLSQAAQHALETLGVEVRLGSAVTSCDEGGVTLPSERIEARTIAWAAGVMASPAGRWLGVETDHSGRVNVGFDLSVPGHPDVFVIGDTASVPGAQGRPLPAIAPVAKQQGAYVAARLLGQLEGKDTPPFRYRDFGSLATVGRKRAVVQMGRLRITGFVAWLLWSMAHIYFLIGFRNRLSVVMNWVWNYVSFQRGTRLITGVSGSRMEGVAVPAAPPSDRDLAKDRVRDAA